jgi:hypothetical protein
VSDFIGRVAARAVGERDAATPRVASLFEASGAIGGGLEVIDEKVVAPVASRAEADPRAPAPAGMPVPSTAGGTASAAARADAAPSRIALGDTMPTESSAEPRGLQPDEAISEPAAEARPAAPLSREHDDERVSAPFSVAAPALTPAVPVVPGARAHAVPAAAASPAEPAPVRVHIGRLEVRANLQERPRRTERTPAPRAQELSLSDYLRGRRESR